MKSKIVYPKAKVNIGLKLVDKRADGYHNIESIFIKIPLYDIIELNQHDRGDGSLNLTTSGIDIPGLTNENLIAQVFSAFCFETGLSINVDVHLHKQIPIGAGLGGGSSNAAYFIKALNALNGNLLSEDVLEHILFKHGSDCAFFFKENPQFVFGTGTEMRDLEINFNDIWMCLVYPNIHISTAQAYAHCLTSGDHLDVSGLSAKRSWEKLTNDFETTVFKDHPELLTIKEKLLSDGAFYASMSGSGSSVFGLFNEKPTCQFNDTYFTRVLPL